MSRCKSGHILIRKGGYVDIARIFPKIFEVFLDAAGQNTDENEDVNDMLLAMNMRDLEAGKKPEGFNRQHSMRLIFPISDSMEMYVYSDIAGQDVSFVTDAISSILSEEGLENEISWDRMVLEELRRKKAQAANRPVSH